MTTQTQRKLDDALWVDLLGIPFRLHGRDEKHGLDCLGLVKTVMHRQGLKMFDPVDGFDVSEFSDAAKCSADVSMFSAWGWEQVSADDAQAGDLVLMSRTRPGVFDHLGIITESGRILHTTPMSGVHVSRFRLDRSSFVLGIVRPEGPSSLVGVNNDKHFTFEHEFSVTLLADPIFNPKSQEVRRLPWHEGLRVRDAIPAPWWENGETAAVAVGSRGERLALDDAIAENDTITVLHIPTGLLWPEIFAIISLILAVASVVYTLVALGTPGSPDNGDDITSPTFRLEGIRNTALNGIPIPILYGEHIVGGNIIQLFHTVQASGHQVLNMLIAISHGPLEGVGGITSDVDSLTGTGIPDEIKINGSLASNFREVEVSLRMGNATQRTLPGFAETVSAISYTWETTNVSDFLHTTTTAVDGFQINFNCPGGLCEFDDGDVSGVNVRFDIYWKEKGTTSWTALPGSGGTTKLYGRTRGPTNRYFRHDLTSQPISPSTTGSSSTMYLDIKVVRQSTGNSVWPHNSTDLNTKIDIVSVNEITDDAQAYPGLALLGLRVQSNEQFQGRTPTVTSVWKGRKLWRMQSVSSAGVPTFDTVGTVPTPTWGDNPADVVTDLLLHPVYGLGRNGLLTSDRLDWQSFYTWKTLCDELVDDGAGGTAKRAICDTVLDESGDGWEVVNAIARSAWGHLVPTGQQISVVVDDEASPVALLGMSDVNQFSVRYDSRDTRPNVVEADFKNVTTDYEDDQAQRVDDGVWTDDDTVIKHRLALVGVTRPIQAFRQCQFRLNWADKVGKVATFKAGIEAIHLLPGDVVNLSHRSVDWGVSGRVLSNEATDYKITLDKKVVLAASDRIVVRTSGTGADVLQTATTVTTGTVAAGAEITLGGGSWSGSDKPQAGDPYSMGSVTTYTKPFIISSIQTDESLTRTFTAVEYNSTVYADDPGPVGTGTDEFPDPNKIPARLEQLAAWEETHMQPDGSVTSFVVAEVERGITTGPVDFFWKEYHSGTTPDELTEWHYAGRTNGSLYRFAAPIRNTTVAVSAVPVSSNGVRGAADAGTFATVFIQGRRVLPTSPVAADIALRQLGEQIVITLPESPDPDFSHYSIKTGNDWACAREIAQAGPGEHHIKTFTDGTVAYFVGVKAVSRSGYESVSSADYAVPNTQVSLPNAVKYSVNSDTSWGGTKSNTQVDTGNLELTGTNLTGTYVEELTNSSDAAQRYGVLGMVNSALQQVDVQWQDAGFTWLSERYGALTWDTTYYTGYEAEEVETWDQAGFTWAAVGEGLSTLITWNGTTDVIADLAPTLEMATSSNDGSSWTDYETYIPGERTLDRVRLKLTLNRPATIYNPQADTMRTAITAWSLTLSDLVNPAGVSDGSMWYYDTGTSTWKTTGADLVFDDATGALMVGADDTDASSVLRRATLTSTATASGAKVIGYDNTASGLSAATVQAAIDENAAGGGGTVALDDITLGDAASTLATSAGNITIDAQGTDTDIIIKGTDGGVDTEFVRVDGSTSRVGIGIAAPLSILSIDGGVGTLATGLTFGDGDSGIYESSDDQGVLDFAGVTGDCIKDQDDMSSDSATHLATQQSIKAYVDDKSSSLIWEHFISWNGNTAAFTSGGAIAGKNASVHDASDYDEFVVMYNFTNAGGQRGMAWNWCVPGDLDVSALVSAKIYFRVSGAVDRTANSSVYWGIDANASADNESTATGGTKFNINTTFDLSAASHASGDLAVMNMGTLFGASSLAVGDYVRGVIWRDPDDAADNYTGTCQHIGIRFIGTKATT